MNTPTRAPSPRARSWRSGSTLVVTMIVLAFVASVLSISSGQMLGMHNLQGANLIAQSNSNAAEAGASLVEGCLRTYASNNAALTVDIAPTQAAATTAGVTVVPAVWMNYMGYTGPYQTWLGAVGQTAWPNLWIGNTMIQWSIQPVVLSSSTYSGTTAPGGSVAYNYNALHPVTGTTGETIANPGFFNYQITVTAYYVDPVQLAQSGQTMASATPWTTPGLVKSIMQVQRQVELKMLNLFQYVIFYGATGPAGDIEFHPGSALTVTGAVHSNNAIYFGGTSLSGTDYHAATDQGGQITIGTNSAYVGIDAPGGIFRLQKDVNEWMVINNFSAQPAVATILDPQNVPQRNATIAGTSIAMSGDNDLNGDTDTSAIVQLNGIGLVSTNDTRTGLKISLQSKYIRDSSNGAGIVQTLANFPQLAGYPFEYQQIVPTAVNGQTTPLCIKGAVPGSAAITWNPNEYTIASSVYPNSQKLYYNSVGVHNWGISTTPSAYPVYASDLPLFNLQSPTTAGATYQDIWPTQRDIDCDYLSIPNGGGSFLPAIDAGTITQMYWPPVFMGNYDGRPHYDNRQDTYLPISSASPVVGSAVEGYFLSEALHGIGGATTTGLVIRERGAPNINFTWDRVSQAPTALLTPQQGSLVISDPTGTLGLGGAPFWVQPSPAPASYQEWANAYAAMMMSKYVVTLGYTTASGTAKQPLDITIPFFKYGFGSHAYIPLSVAPNCFALGPTEATATATPLQQPQPFGMIATSSLFINPREGAWLEANNYLTAAQAAAYYTDALTLNIGQICAFIHYTAWATVDPYGQTANNPASGLSSGFNGIIYAHRTMRTYSPLGSGGTAYAVAIPCSNAATYNVPGGSYPYLSGYSTLFNGSAASGNILAAGSRVLPIYDPCDPLGYNPTQGYWSSNLYLTPANQVSTLRIGSSSTAMYPVVGITTNTNGGIVGAGTPGLVTSQTYLGQPNVWSVYPTNLAVRMYNGSAVNWGGVQPAANNRPQGLTVITPNTCYLQGDYNTMPYPDSSGNQQITPCAVFCDGLTTLSNSFNDTETTYTGGDQQATSTTYIISVVINNQPTDLENTQEEGSDGTHNVIRYMENWGGTTWTFEGSLVVLNRMRYTRSYVPGSPSGNSPFAVAQQNWPFPTVAYHGTTAGGFYGVPARVYKFNSDLLTSAGQPPASLSGVETQRVVNTINLINK